MIELGENKTRGRHLALIYTVNAKGERPIVGDVSVDDGKTWTRRDWLKDGYFNGKRAPSDLDLVPPVPRMTIPDEIIAPGIEASKGNHAGQRERWEAIGGAIFKAFFQAFPKTAETFREESGQ
jgi:hypothetical protein